MSWLQDKGLLAFSKVCSSCSGVAMRLGKRADVSDGSMWRCPQCKTTKSIREGSFFTKSKMPLTSPPSLLGAAVSSQGCGEEAEVHNNIACDVYTWFGKCAPPTLLNLSIILGGPGKVVQVDG